MPESHLIIMPVYNPGPVLQQTVREVLAIWPHLWLVIDGSTDGSEHPLEGYESTSPYFRLIRCSSNRGKGSAVLHGARLALQAGYSHALVMDCDGQHPAGDVTRFIETSRKNPLKMILGQPVFGAEVPKERLWGRQLSVGLAWVEVLGPWIGDPLFGFRVYPLEALTCVLQKDGRGRRYDFDHEAVVRMYWAGIPALKLSAPCRYPEPDEGGVSHFNYLRDNLLLILLHLRLLPGWLFHLPALTLRRQNRTATS